MFEFLAFTPAILFFSLLAFCLVAAFFDYDR